MSLIPENTLNEILNRIDIVELVSEYLPLKRSGRNYSALCPFHHEKTPSFVVNQQKQIFHCFGCQAGGNAFGFVMKHDRLEFPEAVELLAKRAGVIIPREQGHNRNQGLSQELYKINEMAADFYLQLLRSREGQTALDYLKKRGISAQTIQTFRLGYAPDRWDGLLNHLRSKNIPLGLIEKAGLIIAKDNGQGYYDRFRGRLIVPISDIKNRVIAFGARVLDSSLPKYINSPETAVYSKSKTLFGLNLSKEAIISQDCALIVEGYFDLIAPFQSGFNNITASCGTALTVEQIRLLKRYCRNVIMVYDSDNAGQAATMRSLELLVEEEMSVKVVRLEKGYDPDTYLRHSGSEGFKNLLQGALDIVDYMLVTLKAKYDIQDIPQKAKLVSEILPVVARFKNEVLKSEYLKKLSRELSVSEASLIGQMNKDKKMVYKDTAPERSSAAVNPPAKAFCAESMLVKILLDENQLIGELKEKILPRDFKDAGLGKIVAKIFELFNEEDDIHPQELINCFGEGEISRTISELAASEIPDVTDRLKLLNDCVNKIKEKSRKKRQEELCQEIRLAQHSKNENRIYELLNEFQFLAKKGC